MSLDKSLKKASSLARARNVLSRAERLALLQEDELWKPAAGVYNLPKTKYRRLAHWSVRPEATGRHQLIPAIRSRQRHSRFNDRSESR